VRRGALSIAGFCDYASIGRTATFAEIKAGRLIAHKRGRSTIILIEEADAWLQALPRVHPSAPDVMVPKSQPVKRQETEKVTLKSSVGKDGRSPRARHRTSSFARDPPQEN
jgi:hypothetical protein